MQKLTSSELGADLLPPFEQHYVGRGLMKRFETGEELAKEMGLPASKLAQVFADYTKVVQDPKTDPFGKKLCVASPSFLYTLELTSTLLQLLQHRLEPQVGPLQRRPHDPRPPLWVAFASPASYGG